ncbi:MAG TPA: DUF465 domain-containing protein [Oceanospirillales bacterium]|nr:DUF465 domain-containing protein [Oceanospirillales bacterium]
MLGEKHDLHHEFPEYDEEIHYLKTHNNHFARFFKEYDDVDDELHRIAQQIETPSDDYVDQLKRKRLFYKDELYFMILKHVRKNKKKLIEKEKKRLKKAAKKKSKK